MSDKRGPKTSKTQYEIYIKYLQNYKILRTGKLEPGMEPNCITMIYENMVKELNACGRGPVKEIESWKKSFSEWKCNVKKRAREGKEMKDIEKTLIKILGSGIITGLPIAELGLEHPIEITENNDMIIQDFIMPAQIEDDEPQIQELNDLPPTSQRNDILLQPSTSFNQIPLLSEDGCQDKMPKSTTKPTLKKLRGKKALKSTSFVQAFEKQQELTTNGLLAIASSLQDMAVAINRVADVLEQKL